MPPIDSESYCEMKNHNIRNSVLCITGILRLYRGKIDDQHMTLMLWHLNNIDKYRGGRLRLFINKLFRRIK